VSRLLEAATGSVAAQQLPPDLCATWQFSILRFSATYRLETAKLVRMWRHAARGSITASWHPERSGSAVAVEQAAR